MCDRTASQSQARGCSPGEKAITLYCGQSRGLSLARGPYRLLGEYLQSPGDGQRTPPTSSFPETPPHTFMALKSLSAKYSGVLRIHFTEEREGEVELFWLPQNALGWPDPGFFFFFNPLGTTKCKPRKNPGS